VCNCTENYVPPYCLHEDNSIEELKLKILSKLNDTYKVMGNLSNNEFLEILKDLSANPSTNRNKTLETIRDMLNYTFNLEEKTLDDRQSKSVAEILDNMIAYSTLTDCEFQTEFSQRLIEQASAYLAKITQSTMDDKMTNEEATTLTTINFDLIVGKFTECSITEQEFKTSSNAPSIVFQNKDKNSANCSKEVTLSYYAINSNIFDCSQQKNVSKTALGIEIKDKDGNNLADDFNANVLMPPGTSCPTGCVRTIHSQPCLCERLSVFDVRSKLTNIFRNSNLNKILNFNALQDWKFWESAAFWGIFFLISWYLLTLIIICKWMSKYSLLQTMKTPYRDVNLRSLTILFLVSLERVIIS